MMFGYKHSSNLVGILSILLLCPLVSVCGVETKRVIPSPGIPPTNKQASLQTQRQPEESEPLTIGEQLFSHNQARRYKHRRCGMCHLDVERGILHSFIEQETARVNPFTGQPFGRIEAICTTCHTVLHLAHPVGVIPNPQKVVLPLEATGFRGDEDRLTCMSCHDWHPTNTSYKYLRWPVERQENLSQFCLHCHKGKGTWGEEEDKYAKIQLNFQLMSESDPYFKNSQAERNRYFKSYRGAIFNLTSYVQRGKEKTEADEIQIAYRGQPILPQAQLDKARPDRGKKNLVNRLKEFIGLGDTDLAEDYPSQIAAEFEKNYKLGRIYKQRGELNNAIVYLKKAIGLKPDFPPVYCELGQVYLANRRFDAARAMFQRAIGLAPNLAPAYVGLGNVYKAKGNYAPASKAYKTALRLDADYGPAYYQLGLLHKQEGRLDKAQAMFIKAVDASGADYSAAYYELGLIYKESNLPQAEDMFTQAVQKADHAGACYELGLIHKQKGEWASAKDMFQRAVEAKSSNPRAYYELASIYKQQGLIDEVISAYIQATKADKGFAPAYYQLGIIFLENRQLSDATKMLLQVIRLRPDYYEAYYQLAEARYRQKKLHKAIKLYKQVIALQGDYAEGYLGLAKCYRQLGKLKEAIAVLEQTIAIQPEYAQAHYILATIFKDKGWAAEAEKELQLALELTQPKADKSLGLASRLNDKIAAYKITTGLDSEDAEALYNRGVAYMASGQLEEAITAYQQAIVLRPQYREAFYNIALAYKAQKQWLQAVVILQQLLHLNPDFTEARHTLAEILYAQGQWEQAVQQYQQVLPYKPATITYRIGQLYFEQWLANRQRNNLEQAQEYFSRALVFNPQNGRVRQSLQQIQNLLAGKIQTLLITSNDYTKIKEISRLIKNDLPPTDLDRLTWLYPEEARIRFIRPEELSAPLRDELSQLRNGTATNIIRNRKQYLIIYRIDSI